MRFWDLRERYQCGLSPLREALMRLVADGLVVLEDRKGFRVAPVSRQEMLDIANMLVELEAIGIRKSVEKGDDRWEANMVARFHELSKRAIFSTDGSLDPEWEARNIAFHESLFAACDSPTLVSFCRTLSERFSRYRRLWAASAKTGRHVAREHQNILKAALSRDADTAIALLRRHRRRTLDELLANWTAG